VLTEHQLLEDTSGGRVVERRRRRRHRRGRTRRLARIAVGAALLLATMALVAVHQSWRNAPAAGQPPQVDGAQAAAAVSSEAPDAKVQLFIEHTATDQDAARAAELATVLEQRGLSVADVRSVDFQIHRPSIRFFFKNDRPDSEKLVEAIRAFFADAPAEAPDHATDLTDSPQKPRDGELEVWLPTS
jgi:hypothetical protein